MDDTSTKFYDAQIAAVMHQAAESGSPVQLLSVRAWLEPAQGGCAGALRVMQNAILERAEEGCGGAQETAEFEDNLTS